MAFPGERLERLVFRDRAHAGRVLADMLQRYAAEPAPLVLALPRGGVPVAFEVAQALHAPLGGPVILNTRWAPWPAAACG